ncbi:carboxypeptidase regulatory-like domain-containing protein [Candidatus Dojkabacteria bacterium]|uniref:Carboxypeptidase regulatory-like domain-containing protein n=1 Tax=Candidatus Dojkabacteria bacterium TaxID=2099670 RepID=A0A955I7X2_9BACT|nr:carboxypeptidase regulatory-like domain-containing protein [Candidatus Dojkabacteria bacterium]
MEPHPVPQDILNTEFKLFGSFTLKQFLKLLMGALVALVIFIVPMPAIIKWPLIGVSLLIGVGLAIVPRFGVWLSNYLKAMFIAPRYVWVQTTEAPDVLNEQIKKTIKEDQKVSKSKNSDKVNLDEISLTKLLSARDNPRKSTPLPKQETTDALDEPVRQNNIDRLMTDVFKGQQPKVQPTKPVQQEPANNLPAATPAQPRTQEEYAAEIQKLKQEMQSIGKDQKYKDREADILHRINDLMHEMKVLENNDNQQVPVKKINITDDIEGQYVFGIVVDQKGQPISNAQIIFDDEGGNRDILALTGNDGRFASTQKLQKGVTYNISAKHDGYTFHTYKISVGDQKLPAYKLRAKK